MGMIIIAQRAIFTHILPNLNEFKTGKGKSLTADICHLGFHILYPYDCFPERFISPHSCNEGSEEI